MAAAAIPLIAAGLGPILGKLLGGGKEPRLPQELESELINLFHQAGSEAAGLRMMSGELRNKLLAELEHRRTEGIGTPDFNIAVGEALSPNARQTQAGNRERQKAIEEQAGGMRKADDIYGEVSQGIDQYGTGITGTGESIGQEIQGTFDRSAGRGDQASHEVVSNIGNTFGGAIKATSGAYGEFGKDTAGTYGGVRDLSGKAYDETGKLIETLDPSGMAAQARSSRAFEPAMASMALRLRKMGVDPGSPEYNAAMATVESDRARAMDDASIGERDKYIGAKSQNILGKAEKLGGLDLANLKERMRLGETEAEIIRSLGLKQGDEFGKEIIRNLQTQNELDATRSKANIANQNLTQDRSVDYWNKKINAPILQSDLQRKDLETATQVANRGDKTDATNLEIDEGLATKGTNYHVGDLNYRDTASNQMGEVGNTMFNQGTTMSAEGNRAVNTAFNQPEPQGSGWEGAISGAVTAGGGALGKILYPPKQQQQTGMVSTGPNSMKYNFGFFQPERAAGGPVNQGLSYTVGEKGPEKFVPDQPGQIVPNQASVTPGQPGAPGVPFQQSIKLNDPWATQMSQRFNPPAAAPAAPATPPQNTNPNTVPQGPAPVSNVGPVNPAELAAKQLRVQGLGGAPIAPPPSDPYQRPNINAQLAQSDALARRMGPAKGAPAGWTPEDLTGRFDVPAPVQNMRGRLDPALDDPRLAPKGSDGLMADNAVMKEGAAPPGTAINNALAQRQQMMMRRRGMDQRRQMQEMLNRRRPPRRPMAPMPGREVY
jgi:hypothetical protein